jgi:uroporphyrinogen decarboxylase
MKSSQPCHGRELVLTTLRHEPHVAIPWVPFVGVHAGSLIGCTAHQVLTDPDKLVEALLKANELYHPDGQPVVFDLQLEAEILGCELLWAEKTPPAVATHPLAGTLEIPARTPNQGDGRLPFVLEAMRRMKIAVGSHTALYGLVTGPFTLASHLRGTDIFLDSTDNPDYLVNLLEYTTGIACRVADFYIDAGMDVIAVVDPLVSQVSPRHFSRFLAGPFQRVFNHLRGKGTLSSFFVCGDATRNIELMCQTAPDSISVDENIDMPSAKAITDRYNITLGGNIPLTTRMLLGSQQDNMQYVVDLLERLDPTNLIISPGCDMPFDTPVENVVGAYQAVRDPVSTRLALANYHATDVDTSAVVLPDYSTLPRPLIEVFTIDSDTCSACGYMWDAAKRIASEFPGRVDIVEYKFTRKENIARVAKLGIKNLPAMLVNGELKFSSVIPSNRELVDLVQTAMRK